LRKHEKSKSENAIKQVLRFENASPEALDIILNALTAEVDEAIVQQRFPSLDGFFRQFGQGGVLSSSM
jgi:hypothetical protein